jgi:hypothetical protein
MLLMTRSLQCPNDRLGNLGKEQIFPLLVVDIVVSVDLASKDISHK